MKTFTDADIATWHSMIGRKVWKNPKTATQTAPKPFKSGLKVNTVKAVVAHDHSTNLAFTFEEDSSQVECFRCSLAPTEFKLHDFSPRGLTMPIFASNKVDDDFVSTFMYEGLIVRG